MKRYQLTKEREMADNNTDDFYDDPQTMGDTDDEVSGQPDELPPASPSDPSQSIYVPERDTTPKDTRGPIEVQSVVEDYAEGGHTQLTNGDSETLEEVREGGPYRTGQDIDSDHLADVEPSDEKDGEDV